MAGRRDVDDDVVRVFDFRFVYLFYVYVVRSLVYDRSIDISIHPKEGTPFTRMWLFEFIWYLRAEQSLDSAPFHEKRVGRLAASNDTDSVATGMSLGVVKHGKSRHRYRNV